MKHTVLIVDDSNLARLMMRNVISKNFHSWEIMEARNSTEAIQLATARQPDLALLDYNMPDMNGLDLALELMQIHPQLQIFLVTANVQDATRHRAEAAGVGFMTKPVNVDQLEAAFLSQERI
ncbi:MAG: response regulator [Desulfuromonadaceae bacterium]|nr:response regulator [Desulfuromonadaceae bacterium]